MSQLHSLLTANHRPYADVYADAAARLAATGFVRALGGGVVAFAADDLYKKVLQLDDASEWILIATTPTWAQVNGTGSIANGSVTLAKLADLAQATVIGRASGAGTGAPTALTATQLAAIISATKVHETSGPADLTVGAILDGELLIRSGGTIVSVPLPEGGSGGLGDVVGPSSSVDSEVALFDSTTGKLIKRASASGIAKLTSGVLSAVTAPSGALVGDTDAQTLTNKTFTSPIVNQINDSNGNEVVKYGSTGSAVNEVTVTNKAAGTGPTIEATGGDTNINLNLVSKGTGVVQANGLAVATSDAPQTLTDGATVTWATAGVKYPNATVTLGGNRTLAITGAVSGQSGTLVVKQDGTGSRTLALPASSKVRDGGAGAIALSTAANSIDVLSYYYDGANYFWTYAKNYT